MHCCIKLLFPTKLHFLGQKTMTCITQIFVAFALIPLISATCADSQRFKLCYNTYLENFELAADPFPEYRAYKMVREMMLVEEGPSGQTKECGFQNGLISCLAAMEDGCVETDSFATTFNVSTEEATNFVQDYFMMKYTCNAGYSDAMKYFYCLEQVGLYHTDKLVNCSTTEQNALANNVGCSWVYFNQLQNTHLYNIHLQQYLKISQFFRAYNNYIACLLPIYVTQCGADVQKYICNLEVSGISKAAPSCANSLPNCPTSFRTESLSKRFIPRGIRADANAGI